jgi:exosortase
MGATHTQLPTSAAGRVIGRRDGIVAALLALVAIGIMFDAWKDIFRLGMLKEELSYVFLAPVLIIWISWSRRDLLKNCPVRGGWAGLAILAAGWLVFWYGYLTDPVLWRAGAVMIALGAAAAAVGLPVLLRLWPAVVATVFLVPISPNGRYQLAVPLQNATAQVTQTVCDIFGIYVARSGNLLSINGVDVTVAEACNGMRMVLTLLMVCYLVAFTSKLQWWLRVLLLLASPIFAILANVVRLVPTIWMFGHSSRESAEKFHDFAGWAMTFIAFGILMGLVRFIQWALSPDSEPTVWTRPTPPTTPTTPTPDKTRDLVPHVAEPVLNQ